MKRLFRKRSVRIVRIPVTVMVLIGIVLGAMCVYGGTLQALRQHSQKNTQQADTTAAPAASDQSTAAQSPTTQSTTSPGATQPGTPAIPGSAASGSSASGGSPVIRNGRMVPPAYAACPDAFFPPANWPANTPFQLPPPEVRNVAGQTIRLQPGQESVTFSYVSPEGVPVSTILNLDPWQMSGVMPKSTIELRAGTHQLAANTMCFSYHMTVVVQRPDIQVSSVSFDDATNSIRYVANVAPEQLNINYTIVGCQSPDFSVCNGYDTVAGSGASGTIALDALFPELDAYFATYTAQGISMTISPYHSAYTTTHVGTLTFSW